MNIIIWVYDVTNVNARGLVTVQMAGSSAFYREASPSCLSLGSFPWREITLEGLPGVPSSEAVGKTEARELAGGFHYKGSALVASPCRNRFILW